MQYVVNHSRKDWLSGSWWYADCLFTYLKIQEEEAHEKNSMFTKGIKMLLAATLIFLGLLVTVHSIFVDMGLSGIENSSVKIIKYIEEKLDLYESYPLNTEENVTLQKVFDGMMLDHKGV